MREYKHTAFPSTRGGNLRLYCIVWHRVCVGLNVTLVGGWVGRPVHIVSIMLLDNNSLRFSSLRLNAN